MNSKERIHALINEISTEVLQFIRNHESPSNDRWVPAAQIKSELELYFEAVPKDNKQYGPKGMITE